MTNDPDRALFVGETCYDLTTLTDHWPALNEKFTSRRQAFCPGGGAVNAAFCCAELGLPPDLLTTVGLDDLGLQFASRAGRAGIQLHHRDVQTTPISVVRPDEGNRSLLRGPPQEYLRPFPELDPGKFSWLHLDGKQPDAAMFYARAFRERGGIMTSLDTNPRDNTDDLLEFVDVPMASEKYFLGKNCSVDELFAFFRRKGCKVGGVTFGEKGVYWYEGMSVTKHTRAFIVPKEKLLDTSGAGDGFNGALVFSRMQWPERPWESHIEFASAVGALMVQQFGNEQFPKLANVTALLESRPAIVRDVA